MKAYLFILTEILIFLCCGICFANENIVPQREANLSPVMIIRYNKPNTYYDKSLEMLARKALAAKYDANFTIEIVNAPNALNTVDLHSETQNIVNKLVEQNVKIEKIFITETTDQNSTQNEIHIFVE